MTDAEPRNEPVLKRFRAGVAKVYGDRLERVILYGSRARGDNQPDSNYDIAVFMKDPRSFYDESGRLAAITTDILEYTGAVISAAPVQRPAISLTRSAASPTRPIGSTAS